MVTAKLICVFVFAYAKSRFFHDAAYLILLEIIGEVLMVEGTQLILILLYDSVTSDSRIGLKILNIQMPKPLKFQQGHKAGLLHPSYPIHQKLLLTWVNFNKTTCYRNDPKFLDRLVWAESADPDQTYQGLHYLQYCLHLLDALLDGKTSFLVLG